MRNELLRYFNDERCVDYIMEHLDTNYKNNYEKARNVFRALPNKDFVEDFEAYAEYLAGEDMYEFFIENLYENYLVLD